MNNSGQANRLINEKSPYLRQHAYNPVDWWPWCDEAFTLAASQDKPVFLSIGYSTCHWCHVMERESFENKEIADILNRGFISVKVDREERGDLDHIYTEACLMFNGQAGWPMTIIMTPGQKPFFAGSYLPPEGEPGRMGLKQLLLFIESKWKQNRQELDKTAEAMVQGMEAQKQSGQKPDISSFHKAKTLLQRQFDEDWGGFGRAPKFPCPQHLMFLMRYFHYTKDQEALEMAERTLEQMHRGGMFDHVGYGFSRYSTDEKWLLPHFEKMLEDNALLTMAYLEAYQLTKKSFYREVAEQIMVYISREMTSPEGGFYAAQDADMAGMEGGYYLFTRDELLDALGESDGTAFCRRFNIMNEGEHVPNLIGQVGDGFDEEIISRVYAYRKASGTLFRDEKMLTAGNGMMISAFAAAARVLGEPKYLKAAMKAQQYLGDIIKSGDRLAAGAFEGAPLGGGLLRDYAFYIQGLLDIYNACYDVEYLKEAIKWGEIMLRSFEGEGHGLYMTPADGEALIVRPKDSFDGASPCGNSVAGAVLLRLARLTRESRWELAAKRQVEYLAEVTAKNELMNTYGLRVQMDFLNSYSQLLCVVSDEEEQGKTIELLRGKPLINTEVIIKYTDNGVSLQRIAPFTAEYEIVSGSPRYYLCHGEKCLAPMDSPDQLAKYL